MHVRHLSVTDFRSWSGAELALEPGPNVLIGSNGQGKTNLVEALGYLATLGSHRVAGDAPLIRAGADRAVAQAAVVADGRELRIEVEIASGRANRARINGAPVPRPREILGILRTVMFAPEDLAIPRGDPSDRRRFLDELVLARAPRLAGVRADYERVLKQRGALLKSAAAARRGGDLRTLDVWDGHLAEHGAQILRARIAAVRALRPYAAAAYAHVAPASAALSLRYVSTVQPSLPQPADAEADVPDAAVLRDALLAELAKARVAELDRGVNLVGPHRDELDLGIGQLPVRGYASHGECWSVALALRLGSYELLRADGLPGGDPVLILDDVFAELDVERRDQLALTAAKAEQSLVTAAVPADVPSGLLGVRYDVRREGITRD
ncbi:DNA replication/repair protein RecF [uncultured Jatrophihabitans sp.]|uniref:DNA replication/repair protein RecF n=1 Tax=uncultured Jatrophihabitans sp. TaxID=1610747 RepID=UPI0035C9CE47